MPSDPLEDKFCASKLIVGMANHNAFLNPPFENSDPTGLDRVTDS